MTKEFTDRLLRLIIRYDLWDSFRGRIEEDGSIGFIFNMDDVFGLLPGGDSESITPDNIDALEVAIYDTLHVTGSVFDADVLWAARQRRQIPAERWFLGGLFRPSDSAFNYRTSLRPLFGTIKGRSIGSPK